MNKKHFTISAIAMFVFTPSTSFAYIDPASGSMIIQAIVGALAGVAVALKMYWHKFIGFVKKAPTSADNSKNTEYPDEKEQSKK